MRFWDSSAVVPLVVREENSDRVRTWVEDDEDMVVWTLTQVEVRSALSRMAREGRLGADDLHQATQDADDLLRQFQTVESLSAVKNRAKRLLMLHPLRNADAMQLAAALIACSDDPLGFQFVTLDARLSNAARSEGFRVRP